MISIMTWMIASGLGAQATQQADSLFFRGVDAYKRGQFRQSLQTLQSLDRVYPGHQRTTGSLLIQGKALYKLQDYPGATALFEKLLANFPESRYAEDARYGLATVDYRQNRFRDAVLQLIRIRDTQAEGKTTQKAGKLASDIMYNRMETGELKRLLGEVVSENSKAAVALELAKQEIEDRNLSDAVQLIEDFLRLHPNNAYAGPMNQLLSRAQRLAKGVQKIGVVLPLTGALSDPGKSLLSGINFAVNRHNEKGPVKFELLVKDSESRMLSAIKAAQELCRNEDVSCIIGDLESSATLAAAAVAQENGVAFIAPTAMEDGIASVGGCVFQLNGNLSLRAQALAEYAVSSLGLRRFAVLYPADDFGKKMEQAFIGPVERLGGRILADKWYYENAEDLGPQFKAVREAGIRLMIQDTLLPVHNRWVLSSKSSLDRLVAEYADSTAIELTSIDGFFLPVYKSNLEVALSQLAFFNFKTQILGGVSWDAPDILVRHPETADGIIFLSDFYADTYSPQFNEFRNVYRRSQNKMPDKWDVLGCDAAQFFIQAAGAAPLSRKEIIDKLADTGTFNGLRGKIAINQERVNTSVTLLQYKGGKIFKIR